MTEVINVGRFDSKSILNTADAKQRPIDIEVGEKMRLILPSDVKVRPTEEDLRVLLNRMRSYDRLLDRLNEDQNLEPRTATKAAAYNFGGNSLLIALDRESLGLLEGGEREDSLRYPSAEQLLDEAPDATLIPPIFISKQEYRDHTNMRIRDGHHRVTACNHNKNIPFLLAYIPVEELGFLEEEGIQYREVASAMPR